MTIRNWLIRQEIKLLLKHYPTQVKDILERQGKHIQGHRVKRPTVRHPQHSLTVRASGLWVDEQGREV